MKMPSDTLPISPLRTHSNTSFDHGFVLLLLFQTILLVWEVTIPLVVIKVAIAGAFAFTISKKVTEERSSLRKDFYNKFAKVCQNIKGAVSVTHWRGGGEIALE